MLFDKMVYKRIIKSLWIFFLIGIFLDFFVLTPYGLMLGAKEMNSLHRIGYSSLGYFYAPLGFFYSLLFVFLYSLFGSFVSSLLKLNEEQFKIFFLGIICFITLYTIISNIVTIFYLR